MKLPVNPSVSIVMPTKDRPLLVKRAVESVRGQSFKDWELLILDDSQDKHLFKAYEILDPRIKLVEREQNTSVAKARLLGVQKAQGKYVSFLDSDDYWAPTRLEEHLRFWNPGLSFSNRIGLSWNQTVELNGQPGVLPSPFTEGLVEKPQVARHLFKGNFIHSSSGFTKTQYARQIDFSWNVLSDWLLFMRLGENYDACYIDQPLTFRDLSDKNRVSTGFDKAYFYRESLAVRHRLLRNNPRVYWKPWLERDFGRLKAKVGL